MIVYARMVGMIVLEIALELRINHLELIVD